MIGFGPRLQLLRMCPIILALILPPILLKFRISLLLQVVRMVLLGVVWQQLPRYALAGIVFRLMLLSVFPCGFLPAFLQTVGAIYGQVA